MTVDICEVAAGDIIQQNIVGHLMVEYLTKAFIPMEIRHWLRIGEMLTSHEGGRYRLWIAWDEETPVGFCGLSPDGELAPAYVRDSHRRMGVHKRMIIERVLAGGHWTVVQPNNDASIRSLTSMGFKFSNVRHSGAYEFHLSESTVPATEDAIVPVLVT